MRRRVLTVLALPLVLFAPVAYGVTDDSSRSDRPSQRVSEGHVVAAEGVVLGPSANVAPVPYDGVASPTDVPGGPQGSLPTVHAIYVHPSDAPSRFNTVVDPSTGITLAAQLQRDARWASDVLRTIYGRGIRFDERVGGDNVRRIDISVVKSKYDTRRLSSSTQFNSVVNDLKARGFNVQNKKYLVFLDAPSQYCGQSSFASDTQRTAANANEATTYSVAYRWGGKGSEASSGFCGGRTVVHELTHSFGAVQPSAPNQASGAHCNDNANDVLCLYASTVLFSNGTLYDYRQDDYWDPTAVPEAPASARKLAWWTVNLSRFVCPTVGCDAASTPNF